MSTFAQSRLVPVDATTAADLVLDWSRDPLWRGAVTGIRVSPKGRAGPGQRIVERLRFLGVTFVTPTTVEEVTASGASFSGGSAVVRVSGRRHVTAVDAGHSRVDAVVSVALRGPLSPLTSLVAPSYGRRHAADLDRLVEVLTTVAGRARSAPC